MATRQEVRRARRRGRIALLGAVHESLPMLRALVADARVDVVAVLTADPADAPRLAGAVDLGEIAERYGIPAFRGLDLRASATVRLLRDLDLDLMVVVGWTRLVPPPVLGIPRHGCVGFHASLLPRHRGRAPVNWAIINGETRTGATMLMLDAGVDTGPIVDQVLISISDDDTCGTVYDRVADAGVAMLSRHLPALLEGRAPRRRQPPRRQWQGTADVLPKRTPAMGITDWDRSAREVHNWIRALSHPYPGAFSFARGDLVTFWRAEPVWQVSLAALPPPGTLLGCVDGGVLVAARYGAVRLLSVGWSGTEMPAAQWFSQAGMAAGDAFDEVRPTVAAWARGLGPRPADAALAGLAIGPR